MKLLVRKTDIFRGVLGFIKAAKIQGEVYLVLGFRNHRQTCGKPILIFPKWRFHVAEEEKELSLEPQTNKITDYLSAKFDATSIVTDMLS